ncbi:hypothetical protein C0991_008411 [Blastosporella zonata]|nr:hypothetical protein C0991_008411 [Blastosporella zonata]
MPVNILKQTDGSWQLSRTIEIKLQRLLPQPEARNALLAIAFLIEDNVTDGITDTLVEAVVTKTLACLVPIANSLATLAFFASANDSNRADNTLTLQSITDKLTSSAKILNMAPTSTPMPSVTPPPR